MASKKNISIPSPLKKWVDSQVAKKGFATADDYILDVLRREQASADRERIDDILTEAINRGPSTPMTAKDWERIRNAGLQRAPPAAKGMTPSFVISPRADDDLIEIYSLIAQDKVPPADRFLVVAYESFQRLSEMPFLGTKWQSSRTHLAGLRIYPMPNPYRNYIVFYRPTENGIDVLAIFQGSRDLPFALRDL